MKKVSFFTTVGVVFFILLAGRGYAQTSETTSEKPAKPTVVKPTNIVVVLDVSDRLKKDQQIERDIKIVKYIVARFEEAFVRKHLRRGRRAGPYPHRLTFAVPEQPVPVPESSTSEQPKPYRAPSAILEKLKIRDLEKKSGGHPEFKKQRNALLQEIKKLYEFVQNDNPYTGSDIWKWFQENAEHYLRKDSHNYIICLSDGYLKFDDDIEKDLPAGRFIEVGIWREKPNWREYITPLLRTGKDFSDYDITFMMMEINLHRDPKTGTTFPYDLEIMLAHWKPWLEGMGIKDHRFKQQVPEEVLGDVIASFLLPRQVTK